MTSRAYTRHIHSIARIACVTTNVDRTNPECPPNADTSGLMSCSVRPGLRFKGGGCPYDKRIYSFGLLRRNNDSLFSGNPEPQPSL